MIALVFGMPAARERGDVVERHHANGQRASREVLIEGRRHGLHQTWWPNGRLRSQAWYADDAYHGEYRTWREDGRPYELRHFEEGREAGVQQSWDDKGALYLNYEVRNGRRYGFVNAYPCAPGTTSGVAERGGSS